MARYGMLIDLNKCVRCRTCYVVCKVMHDIPNQFESGKRYARLKFVEPEVGKYPEVKRHFLPYHCMQCDNPACMEVCPENAIFRTKEGLISFDPAKCIGCEACVEACPYNARYLNEETGTVDACDLCADRIAEGKLPWCAERCIGHAMMVGDLDDPNSDISKDIKRTNAKPLASHFGTRPKVYYAYADINAVPL
ncbi:MAG: 4Fe-4S dicluster domain-containing protein [Desulfobacterales bacterium]|nr:4Fe-4S dicluster domain-containing protein [Desulfobacterales bacterium]MDD4073010.1 4Fe-4S dicluster domain-containing protein [Desulfobacterales bacterium]MDD4391504.1 4Fe-4S dicluster domain-containing protein [Desulfobacterales bacterium]